MGAKPVSDEYTAPNPKFLASLCNEQNREEMTKPLRCVILHERKPHNSHIFDLTATHRNIVDFIKYLLQKEK